MEMKVDGDAIDIDRFDIHTHSVVSYSTEHSRNCAHINIDGEIVLKTVIGPWSNAFNSIQNNLSSMCNCIISLDLIDFFCCTQNDLPHFQ